MGMKIPEEKFAHLLSKIDRERNAFPFVTMTFYRSGSSAAGRKVRQAKRL
jgi:hypothetical protein